MQISIGPTGPELGAHCQRVTYLCSTTARLLRLNAQISCALSTAAASHEDDLVSYHRSEALGRAADGTGTELAQNILAAWQEPSSGPHDDDITRAAQILEACDRADEAVEFSGYERISIRNAISQFCRTGQDGISSELLASLTQLLTPQPNVSPRGKLPVLPQATARLMRTTAETASVIELQAIAETDPVLASRILATANSVYFGSQSSIVNLRAAVARLGVPLARKVLLSASVGQLFASSTLQSLWVHSREVAAVAHEIAGTCGVDQEAAYVAGLLHDIGRLAIQRGSAEGHAIEQQLRQAGFPLVYAETLAFGFDHTEAGSQLLREWGMPEAIIEAVEFHHRPEATPSALACVLTLAECEAPQPTVECLSASMRESFACGRLGISASRQAVKEVGDVFAIAV